MKEILTDRRLFITVLSLIGVCAFPPAAPYLAGITAAYFANRAVTDTLAKPEKE